MSVLLLLLYITLAHRSTHHREKVHHRAVLNKLRFLCIRDNTGKKQEAADSRMSAHGSFTSWSKLIFESLRSESSFVGTVTYRKDASIPQNASSSGLRVKKK
jgi:hypothetical protein